MTIGELVAYLHVDNDRFNRGVDAARATLGRFGSSFGGFAKTAATMGAKAAAGLAGLSGGVQTIGGLGAVAATAAGSLLVLPAVLGAVKLATLAVTLGMQGFGDAMSALASGDTAAFEAALSKLAPAAQETARAVRDIKPAWDELQLGVQQQLFLGLGDQVRKLAGNYLPILGTTLKSIAGDMGLAINATADWLNRAPMVAMIRTAFDDIREAVANVLEAVSPLGNAFAQVFAVGASFLPGLTAGAGEAAERFADMVLAMQESGQLHDIISNGLSILGDLGQVAGNVGSILGGVFSAANVSGGGLVETLKVVTGSIADLVNSAQGQEVLGAIFATGTEIARQFMAVISALLPAVAPLIPLVAQLASTIGGGLAQVLIAIMPAVSTLVSALVSALQPALPVIASLFAQLAASLGPLAQSLASALAPVLPVIVNVFTQLVGILAPLVSQLAGVLAPLLPQIANLFLLLVQALMPLLPPIAQLISALLPPLAAILSGVVVPAITLAIGIIGALAGVLATVLTAVAGWVTSVSGLFTNLLGTIGSIVNGIVNFVVSGFLNARDAALGAFSAMVSGVSGFIGNLLGYVGAIPGKILGLLGGLGSLLLNSGRALVDGFLSGIKAAWDRVVSFVKQGVQWVRDLFPFSPAKTGPFSGSGYVTHSGKALTSDFAKSLRAGMPTVVDSARQVMDAAHVAMSPTLDARSTGLPGNAWLSRGCDDRSGPTPDEIAGAVGDAVHRALDGARMDVDGRGVARLVNRTNLRDGRRGAGGFTPALARR